jgi:hypothetical protein
LGKPRQLEILWVVFDIDETIVKRRKADSMEDGMIELHLSSEPSSHFYTLLPGILELLQYLILEKKLNIAFFSHDIDERNQALIPIILERSFPDSHREIVQKTPIFSRQQMQRKRVKDLNVVIEYYRRTYGQVVPLDNVILIDDIQEFAVKDQNLLLVPAKECRNNVVKEFFMWWECCKRCLDLLQNREDAKSVMKSTDEFQALSSKVQSTRSQLYLKRGYPMSQEIDRLFEFDSFSCDVAHPKDFFTTRFGLAIRQFSRDFSFAVQRNSLRISKCSDDIQFNPLKILQRLQ